ncbi:MAG: hypothetical protein A3D16_06990 [Rhodobacterales bacterium RIFCSPHIGHO2_02_FULL_62_130]|jgi:outer membrane immunogenic protein|nr:MAG: hypothetical protein A3D16_06990 [Rhodobacterales bacterium RIFCSPHIGHO2_02_FULL_62_130]OHC57201.1 MAG: hypothetical protein A3E48_04870 [Rhodobacterales bacterium RIFCSPHIGHO2_12_FULL_62_75]HCZ01343.1 hypothetical protein [Rhodobacter sp.]
MKRLKSGIAAALLVVTVGAAHAEDMTGLYFGGHLGSAQASGDYMAYTPRNSYDGFDMQGLDGSALAGGVHAGYNWDQGAYLFGVEGTLTAFDINTLSTTSELLGEGAEFGRSVGNMATLAPKLGIKLGNGLIYAKAGLAVGSIGATHDQNGEFLSGSATQTGWMAGIGAEFPMAERLTMRVDYTYADFGLTRTDMFGDDADIWVDQSISEGLLTVGFNYYFK